MTSMREERRCGAAQVLPNLDGFEDGGSDRRRSSLKRSGESEPEDHNGAIDSTSSRSVLPEALRQNFTLLKKRKVTDDEATRVAKETQAMISSEVFRMRNAVAELEVYLETMEAAASERAEIEAINGQMGAAGIVGQKHVVVEDDSDEEL